MSGVVRTQERVVLYAGRLVLALVQQQLQLLLLYSLFCVALCHVVLAC